MHWFICVCHALCVFALVAFICVHSPCVHFFYIYWYDTCYDKKGEKGTSLLVFILCLQEWGQGGAMLKTWMEILISGGAKVSFLKMKKSLCSILEEEEIMILDDEEIKILEDEESSSAQKSTFQPIHRANARAGTECRIKSEAFLTRPEYLSYRPDRTNFKVHSNPCSSSTIQRGCVARSVARQISGCAQLNHKLHIIIDHH